jgi:soluble lytic murein transglycosylase-like protein
VSVAELLCAAFIALGLPNSAAACEHMETVVEASTKFSVDPVVMVALIHVESRWNIDARSHSNACGLTQALPKYTRKFYGGRVTCRDLFNPKLSIYKGADILGYYLRRYKRNYRRSLCTYNAGARGCRGKKMKRGTRYARKIMKLTQKLRRKMKRIKGEEGFLDANTPGCYE